MKDVGLYLDNVDIKIQFGAVQLNVLYLRSEPNIKFIRQHSHKSYELHYICNGQGVVIVEGKEYKLKPGLFYITGPDIKHEQRGDEFNLMSEYCICFEIMNCKSNFIENELNQDVITIANVIKNTMFWIGEDEHNSIELFNKLFYEITNQFIGYYMNIKSYVEEIIINAVRYYTKNLASSNPIPVKSIDDRRIVILEEYLYNFTGKLSLNEIAGKLALSTRQTDRIFKKYYNISFIDKVMQLRMELASNLLCTTSLTITEIAVQTGFSSIYDFCKYFKKYYGISARKYREINKSKYESV